MNLYDPVFIEADVKSIGSFGSSPDESANRDQNHYEDPSESQKPSQKAAIATTSFGGTSNSSRPKNPKTSHDNNKLNTSDKSEISACTICKSITSALQFLITILIFGMVAYMLARDFQLIPGLTRNNGTFSLEAIREIVASELKNYLKAEMTTATVTPTNDSINFANGTTTSQITTINQVSQTATTSAGTTWTTANNMTAMTTNSSNSTG